MFRNLENLIKDVNANIVHISYFTQSTRIVNQVHEESFISKNKSSF